jgi:hypothetical protein
MRHVTEVEAALRGTDVARHCISELRRIVGLCRPEQHQTWLEVHKTFLTVFEELTNIHLDRMNVSSKFPHGE